MLHRKRRRRRKFSEFVFWILNFLQKNLSFSLILNKKSTFFFHIFFVEFHKKNVESSKSRNCGIPHFFCGKKKVWTKVYSEDGKHVKMAMIRKAIQSNQCTIKQERPNHQLFWNFYVIDLGSFVPESAISCEWKMRIFCWGFLGISTGMYVILIF